MAARGVLTYLAVGVAVAVLSPVLLPPLIEISKPLMKGAIKGGILLYRRSRQAYAEMAEVTEDLVAETMIEIETGDVTQPGHQNVTHIRQNG